ncbi:uncharacterized protein LOC117112279 isoform X2 [Anneissia japonica]|uniref:uncharacterized protein LOC117112279 isoform X2 n=1 Tax=Anneissia japonica TaxID=1529436 RepID=UPI001425B58A|nr:uncharacterized protein LOC117112279 isoform X2 [Anneissia japonica]
MVLQYNFSQLFSLRKLACKVIPGFSVQKLMDYFGCQANVLVLVHTGRLLGNRPPPSARNGLLTSVFLREFDEFIDTVHLLLGELLIMGDLNVHFDLPSKPDVAHVLASVSSADLVQVVTKPTYVHMDTYLIHLLPVWIPVLSIIVYIVTTIQTMLLSVLTLLSEALNVFQGLLRIDLMVTLTMVSLVLILPLSWLLY